MARQRIGHGGMIYVFPNDFPERLKRFQRESGLSWAEIALRLGTSDLNLRRWRDRRIGIQAGGQDYTARKITYSELLEVIRAYTGSG